MTKRSLSILRSAIGQRVRLREPANHQRPAATLAVPENTGREVELLDWVRLNRPFEGWPGGTLGAVVDLDESEALIEITDERGHSVDLFSVPVELLRVDA